MQITRRLRLEKDIVTHITKILPGSGKFVVQAGREVTPDEIIGTSIACGGFRIINIASLLNVPPKMAGKYLQKKAGQRIYTGELLAYKQGGILQGKKIITVPTDGTLDFINSTNGDVKISFPPKKINMPAGVFGVVEFVDNAHGKIFIRTQVTRVHGLFGSGRQRGGILRILDNKNDLISAKSISDKDNEHILVGKGLIYKEAISAAISKGVSGIITGGVNVKDYKGMAGSTDVGVSLIVCEGFGLVPVGKDILDVLIENNQKYIFIDGNKAIVNLPDTSSQCMLKIKGTRLPLNMETDIIGHQVSLIDSSSLTLGVRVRVIGTTYLGEQGKIVKIDKSKTKLASGIWAHLLTIETKFRKLQIPVDNIELI